MKKRMIHEICQHCWNVLQHHNGRRKAHPVQRNGQYRNQYTLGKARQQSLAGLRRTLCSLAIPPKLFITLIIPNHGRQPFDYPTCRKVFNSFTR